MAGKSGTTNDFHDAWMMAYSPNIVMGAWVGHTGPGNPNMNNVFGTMVGSSVLKDFINNGLPQAKIPAQNFQQPDGLVSGPPCSNNNNINPSPSASASPSSAKVCSEKELYLPGTECAAPTPSPTPSPPPSPTPAPPPAPPPPPRPHPPRPPPPPPPPPTPPSPPPPRAPPPPPPPPHPPPPPPRRPPPPPPGPPSPALPPRCWVSTAARLLSTFPRSGRADPDTRRTSQREQFAKRRPRPLLSWIVISSSSATTGQPANRIQRRTTSGVTLADDNLDSRSPSVQV